MRLATITPIPQSTLPGLIRTHLGRPLQQGLMECSPPSVSRKPILSRKASYLQSPRHCLRLRRGQLWLSALVQLRPQPHLQLPLQRHQVRTQRLNCLLVDQEGGFYLPNPALSKLLLHLRHRLPQKALVQFEHIRFPNDSRLRHYLYPIPCLSPGDREAWSWAVLMPLKRRRRLRIHINIIMDGWSHR